MHAESKGSADVGGISSMCIEVISVISSSGSPEGIDGFEIVQITGMEVPVCEEIV